MNLNFEPNITLFQCINTFAEKTSLPLSSRDEMRIKTVQMACSSMVKDVFLLRAFETGADAVVVLVCPEGHCRYVEGNIRAKKRVEWVKKLLDEIEFDGRRLSIFNISSGDEKAVAEIIGLTLTALSDLGPNPAAQNSIDFV
jgi:coenzyme F420-reducing hydrogenase delta subunit